MKGTSGVPVIDSVSGSGAITTNGWHNVAVVGDGTRVTFWIDGVGTAGTGTFGTLSTGGSSRLLSVGRCTSSAPACQFDGRIDEVQIYNRALGAAEIRSIYDSGAGGVCKCTDADGDGYGAQGGLSCSEGTLED